jgi:hypothetical protein
LTGEFIRQDEEWGIDLPQKGGSTKKAGVLMIEEYAHSEEARDDHEIRTNEE